MMKCSCGSKAYFDKFVGDIRLYICGGCGTGLSGMEVEKE